MEDRSPHRGQRLFVPCRRVALLVGSAPGAGARRVRANPLCDRRDATLAWYQVIRTTLCSGYDCPKDPLLASGREPNEPGGTRGLPLPKDRHAMMRKK